MSNSENSRDRDAAGRARNARPRDALGRPLPRGAAGVATQPDGPPLAPEQALDLAQQLLDDARPFHAHEVLEAAWKAAPPASRELWRGLAQLAVGLTHAARGNSRGAVALLVRGADRVAAYGADAPFGVDAAGLARWARRSAERIAAAPARAVVPDAPRLRRPAPGPVRTAGHDPTG